MARNKRKQRPKTRRAPNREPAPSKATVPGMVASPPDPIADSPKGEQESRTHRFQLPKWFRDLGAWRLVVALIAISVTIALFVLRSHWEVEQKTVAITAHMFVNPKSGFTDRAEWPVVLAFMNAGPAEARNFSVHLQLERPQRIRHAAPVVLEKPAGTSVEVSAHGHGDEYVINLKNLVPHTAVTIQIEFRAETEDVKNEFIDRFKANPFSGVFLAEFVKELSFEGENVTSEIRVGMLKPVSVWNGFEVLRNASLHTDVR